MVKLSGNDSPGEGTPLMWKVNEALLLASDEREILAAVGLCADHNASLQLFYVDWISQQPLDGFIVPVATLDNGKLSSNRELHNKASIKEFTDVSALMTALAACPDPVWYEENLPVAMGLTAICFFPDGCQSMAAIKLQNLGQVEENANYNLDAVICFVWSEPHSFSNEERYTFAAIAQFASAVVANLRMHKEIVANVTRLQKLDKLKDEFLYSMSHELRTPLGSIITLSEAILAGADGEIAGNLRADVESIHDSGHHLYRMIADILDFASIEAGNVHLEREATSLVDVANNAVREIMPMIEVQHKQLGIRVMPSPVLRPAWVDRTRSHQVVLNLLSNAVKFADHGVIEISFYLDGEQLVVCVHDEGIGIEADQQAVIFQKFRQVNGSLTRKTGGNGLGLAICKQLVELQGGRIWVESTSGQGSSFYFTMPTLQEQAHETAIY